MKRCTQLLIYGVALALFNGGCATETAIPIREGSLTTQENQWLAKAYRHDENGWIYLHIEGTPFERGFQRGYLTANEIDEFLRTLAYTVEFETAKEPEFFVKQAAKLFKGRVSKEQRHRLFHHLGWPGRHGDHHWRLQWIQSERHPGL